MLLLYVTRIRPSDQFRLELTSEMSAYRHFGRAVSIVGQSQGPRFEPTIPMLGRSKTIRALDREATGIGTWV